MAAAIPSVPLSSGDRAIPAAGLGTGSYPRAPPEAGRQAVLDTIALGYRHFDTAPPYGTEQWLGEAIAEAVSRGLVKGRGDLFITTKLWCSDAHGDRVLPALRESLRKLQLEYVDLYIIHWPISLPADAVKFQIDKNRVCPIDIKSVWEAMEECQMLGLAKSIGVSNFTCKKLDQLLLTARIPPAAHQVEMHPLWQQKKLRDYCKDKGIQVTAYSPLGANGTPWGTNQVMECNVLKEIAMARGKSLAQISLRWIYEQGVPFVVKSFKKERMKENIDIFSWELHEEDLHKISQIQQCRGNRGDRFFSVNGAFRSPEEFWDGEI